LQDAPCGGVPAAAFAVGRAASGVAGIMFAVVTTASSKVPMSARQARVSLQTRRKVSNRYLINVQKLLL
jgi:hypothetical protein